MLKKGTRYYMFCDNYNKQIKYKWFLVGAILISPLRGVPG